jgi:hypothetical protein
MPRNTPKAGEVHQIHKDLQSLALPIESVRLAKRNAKDHPPESIEAIAASLKRYGQMKPIVYNIKSKEILAGNGTYQAAVFLGWTHIAVVKVTTDKNTSIGYALADNRTADFGKWNDLILLEQVTQLAESDPDMLTAMDFDDMLADLPAAKAVELKELHVQPPPPRTWVLIGVPTVRFGEISSQIEKIAKVDGFIVETTSNNG